jgi:glyoxylase-like metal-dependent hydrolase (beta-lactamase superfamily II)
VESWSIGSASVVRVADEEFELLLPLDATTATALRPATPWLVPHFITDDGNLRIGSSAIAIRSGGLRIVVDPWLAFDPPDRHGQDAASRATRLLGALEAAGYPPAEVDIVINTHIDGVGLNVLSTPNGEIPAFPAARYLFADEELAGLGAGRRRGVHALETLVDDGRVDRIEDGQRLSADVTIEMTRGHSSGHVVVHIDSDSDHAVVAGHLFLHPAQVFDPAPRADLDADPCGAAAARRHLLERAADDGALLVGPLFAAPGGGWVVADADRFRLALR